MNTARQLVGVARLTVGVFLAIVIVTQIADQQVHGAFLPQYYFTYFTIDMARESLVYGDRAIGQLPILLWIPQAGAALGMLALTIAFIDDFVAVIRREKPSYHDAEMDLQSEG